MFKKIFVGFINVFTKLFYNYFLLKIISIYLGPSGVGLYSQYRSVWQLFSTISNLNASAFIVQRLSNSRNNIQFFIGSFICVFLLNLIFSFLILFNEEFITNIIFNKHSYEVDLIIFYTAIIFPLSSLIILLMSSLNGFKFYLQHTVISILVMLIYIITVVIFAKNSISEFYEILKIILISEIITFFLLIIFLLIKLKNYFFTKLDNKIIFNEIKNFIKNSLFFLVSGLLFLFSILIIKIFIIKEFGYRDLGFFESAWSLSIMLSFIALKSLGFYYLPELSDPNKVNFNSTIQNYLEAVPLIIIVLYVPLIIFNKFLLSVLFTSEFIEAHIFLRWLIISEIIKLYIFVFNYPIIAKAKFKAFLLFELFFTILFLILSIFSLQNLKSIETLCIIYCLTNLLYLFSIIIYSYNKINFKFVFSNLINFLMVVLLVIYFSVINWHQSAHALYNIIPFLIFAVILYYSYNSNKPITGKVNENN